MSMVKKSAKSIVRKYKKLSLRKEMNRLRQTIPNSKNMKDEEVLQETVSVIEELEHQLMMRLQAGRIPKQLVNYFPTGENVKIEEMRQAMLAIMGY